MRWHEDPRVVPWRYISIVLLLGLVGFGVALALIDTTYPGLDLQTYQRAGDAFWTTGDAYSINRTAGGEQRYLYPPLLAMTMPVLGWAPLWYALLGGASFLPLYVGWRSRGAAGLLLPMILTGAWAQQLLNGNVQPLVVAALLCVPFFPRAGGIALAFATMLKLHPALAVIWYIGRRDWTPLKWFLATLVFLLLIQLRWLSTFLDFLSGQGEDSFLTGVSILALGEIPWGLAILVTALIAYANARDDRGWGWAVLLQIVALPRLLYVNLALLLAAPQTIVLDPARFTYQGSSGVRETRA